MVEIDYTKIKQDLKDYLEGRSDFTDYNFEGSAMGTLLDILAYNTQNLALVSNLAFSETFIDSANQRSSLVSRAAELGYIPRSSQAATANITASFSVTGNPSQYTIPKYTKFTASGSSKTYEFITTADVLINNTSNVFTGTFDIVQGSIRTYTYTVDTTNLIQKFIIPSKTADRSYLTVTVNGIAYTDISSFNIGDIAGDSTLYYIKENIDGYFEIYFGDNVLGKSVNNGDVIVLTYIDTDEDAANSLSKFSLSSTLTGVTSMTITCNQSSIGGAPIESIESIRFNAPLAYQQQQRAVTKHDYISLIKQQITGFDDVTVWGGEENDPPYYGKVFIALKPHDGKYISTSQKERIKSIIKSNYSVLTVRPEVVDPVYIDIGINVTTTYSGKTYNVSNNLETTIRNSIINFFDNYGNKFGESIYHSSLVDSIQNSDSAIINTVLDFILTKYNTVYFGISGTYTYTFNNYITPNTIRSKPLLMGGNTWYIKDVPSGTYPYTTGILEVVNNLTSPTSYYSTNIGTVDYTTGKVIISNIVIDSLPDSATELALTVNPGSYINSNTVFTDYNIYTNEREELIRLQEDNITITLLPDNTK